MKTLKTKTGIITITLALSLMTATAISVGTFYRTIGASKTKISEVKEELVKSISANSERMAVIETQYKTLIDNQNKIIKFLME